MIAIPNRSVADIGRPKDPREGWSRAVRIAPDLYPGVGGKRFRAELLERAYGFAGGVGDAPTALVDAIETLHAGSLVIDDFEDGSRTRRNQPAMHRVVGPARAVNAGNWMYFKALELAASAYPDSRRTAQLLAKFVETARQCHEGQAIDLAMAVDTIAPQTAWKTALQISYWKTGRLTALAAWCGAQAAGADAATLRAVSTFGCRLGVCLQMKNDLDEIAGFVAGSDRFDDLRNRRVTWPWAWAGKTLTPLYFAALQNRLSRSIKRPAALRVVAKQLVNACRDYNDRLISSHLDRAVMRLTYQTDDSAPVELLANIANRLREEQSAQHSGGVA